MIGRITGILLEKQVPFILIDVSGVGYEVQVSMNTLYQLPKEGKGITLHIHFVVREDAQLLYGFYAENERRLFRSLIKVNGIGPKLALAILSGIGVDQFVHFVMQQDAASLVKIPGVGRKTADRLLVEMRDKLSDWQGSEAELTGKDSSQKDGVVVRRKVVQDAVSALISLGYKPQDASRAVATVENEALSSEEMIRLALKQMVA